MGIDKKIVIEIDRDTEIGGNRKIKRHRNR